MRGGVARLTFVQTGIEIIVGGDEAQGGRGRGIIGCDGVDQRVKCEFDAVELSLQLNLDNPIVVSPDIGGVVRARAIAKLLNDTDMAIIDKRRPRANVSQVMHIIGDVAGRDCVLVDDMIDTGGTLCKAAEALKERGAKRVFAYATHPIFSGNAVENLRKSVIDQVIVCDTIPLSDEMKALPIVRTLTLSGMLAEPPSPR